MDNSLDRIDHKILAALQQDGRMSMRRLSELVFLTPRPCLERVRRLQKMGVIKGYTALVEWPNSAPPVVMLAQVALLDHGESQQAFSNELMDSQLVLDSWLVSGQFDFLVRIGCKDTAQYRQLTERWMRSTAFHIEKITTLSELKEVKRGRLGHSMPSPF